MNDAFELAWSAFPRRVNKFKAREAFTKALKKTTLDEILTALEWQRELPNWQERDEAGVLKWVPHFSTWLNQERWTDERPVKRTTAAIIPFNPAPTCGECLDGWREDERHKVYRCPCRTVKARTA